MFHGPIYFYARNDLLQSFASYFSILSTSILHLLSVRSYWEEKDFQLNKKNNPVEKSGSMWNSRHNVIGQFNSVCTDGQEQDLVSCSYLLPISVHDVKCVNK